MSYFEDYIEPALYREPHFSELSYMYIEEQAKKRIWIMKDGTEIPVSKMTDSHIKNAINLIKRKDRYDLYLPWIEVLEAELKDRELF